MGHTRRFNKSTGMPSRSMLRRQAIQKGEPMPSFEEDQEDQEEPTGPTCIVCGSPMTATPGGDVTCPECGMEN